MSEKVWNLEEIFGIFQLLKEIKLKSGGNLMEILVPPVWSIEEIIGNLLTKSLIMIYSAGILTFVRHR